jgi:hypothetical protein
MRPIVVVPLLVLAGCCDCVVDGIELAFVDPDGEPASFDTVDVVLGGAHVHDVACEGRTDCTRAFVALPAGEGTYTLTIGHARGTTTETVELVTPPRTPGVCCSDTFSEERTVVLQP